jgi:hypothetical protein
LIAVVPVLISSSTRTSGTSARMAASSTIPPGSSASV